MKRTVHIFELPPEAFSRKADKPWFSVVPAKDKVSYVVGDLVRFKEFNRKKGILGRWHSELTSWSVFTRRIHRVIEANTLGDPKHLLILKPAHTWLDKMIFGLIPFMILALGAYLDAWSRITYERDIFYLSGTVP